MTAPSRDSPDSIRYELETFFFGIAANYNEDPDNMEAEGQGLTDALYDLLDRNGYELARKADSDALIRMIAANGRLAHSNALVGNPAPAVQRVYERMKAPQPGDLVMELSIYGYHGEYARPDKGREWTPGAVGRLVKIADEHVWDEETWRSPDVGGIGPYEDSPRERIYYIQRLDTDEVVRWHNAEFIAIPDGVSEDAWRWPML